MNTTRTTPSSKTASASLAVAALLTISVAAISPGIAAAETTATSTITQMKLLEKSHENYRLFHGALWLEYDKATHNYRWGGAHCKNQGIGDLNVSLLFAAFRSKYSVNIEYKMVNYRKRSYRCITGFSITR